jgi:hypothetical protein
MSTTVLEGSDAGGHHATSKTERFSNKTSKMEEDEVQMAGQMRSQLDDSWHQLKATQTAVWMVCRTVSPQPNPSTCREQQD